jgi:hypothetical protein
MARNDEQPAELNISQLKAEFIIIKAREYDAKVEPDDPDSGSNPADDGESDVLEDFRDDATLEELRSAIDDLNEDEVVDLIALAWLGRGDFQKDEWPQARALAGERHRAHSAEYLIGIPMLGDYIEEGYAKLGYSTTDFGATHL